MPLGSLQPDISLFKTLDKALSGFREWNKTLELLFFEVVHTLVTFYLLSHHTRPIIP